MLNDQRSLIKEKKKEIYYCISIVFGKNIINVLFILFIYIHILYI